MSSWREVSIRRRQPGNGRVRVRVLGSEGPVPARILLKASDGRAYAPDGGFHRVITATETHYFHTSGEAEIEVPAGRTTIEAVRGFEYRPQTVTVDVTAGETEEVTFQLERLIDLPAMGWYSGDTHIHDLHQGRFGQTHGSFYEQLVAEDLHMSWALIHMDGTRLMGRWSDLTGEPHPLSTGDHILQYAQEFRGSLGHIALLGIHEYLLPFRSGVGNTAYDAVAPEWTYVDAARAQGGMGGFVHPYNRRGSGPGTWVTEVPGDMGNTREPVSGDIGDTRCWIVGSGGAACRDAVAPNRPCERETEVRGSRAAWRPHDDGALR
jgi:hypothetical protein